MEIINRAAFFDVDNTIVQMKTMFSFSEYYFRHTTKNLRHEDFASFMAFLKNHPLADRREQLNRAFYAYFEGVEKTDFETISVDWFSDLLHVHGDSVWHLPVLEMLRILRSQQYSVVAVSGSFSESLQPISQYLGLDDCLSTHMLCRDGVYTGEIAASMIGNGKVAAIHSYAKKNEINLAQSVACGDHISDLAMLEAVGEPYVVAGDPELESVARQRGWPVIAVNQSNPLDADTHV